jgi:hypothetical protein
MLKHVSFKTYYPQGSGQVECTSKVFWTLLTKFIGENKQYWDEHMSTMLFSYKTAYKVTRYIPYQLMYALHPLMPIEYIVLIISGNERQNTLVKVLTNKIIKLEKL